MTVRGGGVPYPGMALMPPHRMGPPPRSFAADAHYCIMVRVSAPTEYKDAARYVVRDTRAPPQIVIPTRKSVPSCSEPSRPSLRWPPKGRPALTAPARASVSIVWVGAKKRAFKSNKETEVKKWIGPLWNPLDKTNPIQGFLSEICIGNSEAEGAN